jgi:ribosomal protein L30E
MDKIENNLLETNKIQITKCPICLNDFQVNWRKNRKYCSDECSKKGERIRDLKYHIISNKKRKEYYRKVREYIDSIKKNSSCFLCGENRFYTLDFHHKNPDNKKFGIANANMENRTIEEIQEEIDKCLIICANCHSEIHLNDVGDKSDKQFDNLKKICKQCGNIFMPTFENRIYCCDECFKKRRKYRYTKQENEQRYFKRKICKHCGNTVNYSQLYVSRCCNNKDCIQKEIDLRKKGYINYNILKIKKNKINKKDKRNRINATVRRGKFKSRQYIKKYKQDNKCIMCNNDKIHCLEFHHFESDKKEIGISKAISRGWGIDAIKKEMEKCTVLCKNCHKEIHYLEKIGKIVVYESKYFNKKLIRKIL